MRKLFALLCVCGNLPAAITNVSVSGVTNTQAILRYTAPDAAACRVEISESPTLTPLVNDVDPAKFRSASSDSRAGSAAAGAERTFVAGKRAAEIGLDTIRYSRALQTATVHYYRITCASTGDQVSGQFETENLPFGSGYAEAQAIDATQPGKYAWPTLSLTDRTQQVIDPQTGVLLKRLNLSNDVALPINGFPLGVARGSSWTDLPKLAASDGKGAFVSGDMGKLFLGLPHGLPYGTLDSWASAYGGGQNSAFDYFQAHIIAAVNPGGTSPSSPEDAKIVVCLTIDGTNCYDGSSQYEAVLSPSFREQTFGTTKSVDLWQSTPGTAVPNFTQIGTRAGASICDGTNTVSYVGGELYGIHWRAGSGIFIGGIAYTIANVINTAKLTLTTNCPSMLVGTGSFDPGSRTWRTPVDSFTTADNGRQVFVAGAGGGGGGYSSVIDEVVNARTAVFHDFPPVQGVVTQFGYPAGHDAPNFGVLLWKKTNSADRIAVDYAYVNYERGYYGKWILGGGTELCSAKTVIGPNRRPGYNCVMPEGTPIYWVDAESGEAHIFNSSNTEPNVNCQVLSNFFDLVDPDRYLCGGTGVLYTTKYYGNHGEPFALNPNGNLLLFQNLRNCNTSPPNAPPYQSQQPCIVTSILTPGTSVVALAESFTANPAYAPAFDKSRFRNLTLKAVDSLNNILMHVWRGGGNSIGWALVFNPNATANSEGGTMNGPAGNHGCTGNGVPGCIVAALPGWQRPGCRWCTVKGGDSPIAGWFDTATYAWIDAGPGTGPYYVPVIDGSADGNINYVDGSSSLQECPANIYGATGRNCTTLTVGSEPLSPNHGDGETGLPGELGPTQPNDRFQFISTFGTNNTEQVTLIKKVPGSQPGTWVYTLWRDVNHSVTHNYFSTGANPRLYTVCNANQFPAHQGSGYSYYWNFLKDPHGMNADGTTIPPDLSAANDHAFWLNGSWGSAAAGDLETRCTNGVYCYSSRVPNGRPFEKILSDIPANGVGGKNLGFGGGSADFNFLQSHPVGGGATPAADRINYMFDGRPYRGGFSSGSLRGSGDHPATRTGTQLYKFAVTDMTNIDLPFRKIYPTAAFTGNMPLVDISSPATGDVLGTELGDSYKYCVAAAVNECRSGSAVGDVYINAPYVRYPYCYIAEQAFNLPDEYDLCVNGTPPIRDAIVQIAMDKADNAGQYQRIISKFNRPRVLSPFFSPYVLPNAKWLIMESHLVGDGSTNKSFMLAKLPPPPAADNINRLDFVPIAVKLPAVPGATQGYVRFGYSENGNPSDFFCTSRHEACVVGTPSGVRIIDAANPFYLEQTEASAFHPADCTSGCTINVPGIPGRILYYQYVYSTDSGVQFTSSQQIVAVP